MQPAYDFFVNFELSIAGVTDSLIMSKTRVDRVNVQAVAWELRKN